MKTTYWHVSTVFERVVAGCAFDGVHLDPDECKRILDVLVAVRASRSRKLKQLLAERVDEPGEIYQRGSE